MIEFKELGVTAPDGCVIGILADDSASVQAEVLRVGPGHKFPRNEAAIIFDHAFSRSSAVEKAKAVSALRSMSNTGCTVILISHDEGLLEKASDEIWVVEACQLTERGDPAEVLHRYRAAVATELRSLGQGAIAPVSPTMRKGDGRAAIHSIELLGEADLPSNVWRSGEAAAVRIAVDYLDAVADPVVGILIRTRIGLNVYGTNTELEGLRFGPVSPGEQKKVTYRFRCDLCPGDYTVTAASHDPDGVWHEWLQDAVAFTVTDVRYTAGVANLRANVSVD